MSNIWLQALRNLSVVFEKSHARGFSLFDRVGPGCVQVFLRMVRHHLEEGDETQRITGAAKLICLLYYPACCVRERTEVFYFILYTHGVLLYVCMYGRPHPHLCHQHVEFMYIC